MKFLSWNILHGGGTRCAKICSAIKNHNPHVVVLSEFRNNANGAHIRTQLLKSGYIHQWVTGANEEENAVCVLSKIPGSVKVFHYTNYTYKNNILKINLDAINIYAVYMPHKKKHKLFELLNEELKDNIPSIILGDLNTGENFIDQKGDSFWYTKQFKDLKENGYPDAFRIMNGDKKEYSWFSHQGNGFRYDHILIHQDLTPLIESCNYLHEWRVEKWSDHAAQELILKI